MSWGIRCLQSHTYYKTTTGIGPAFGANAQEAVRFETEQEAREHMLTFPVLVCAEAVQLPHDEDKL